jgi:hypothetical protein
MQAIVTRYHGPTDYHGARVSARCDAGCIVIHWDYTLDTNPNHDAACNALLARLGWLTAGQRWVGGSLPGRRAGRAYTCCDAVHAP